MRRLAPPARAPLPALPCDRLRPVELPDAGGVRLVSNVIDVRPGELQVGLAVEVVFEDLEDVTLPRFGPARCAG